MKTIKTLLTSALLFTALLVNAQTQPIDANGLAIGGYDVVAYFNEGATKGKSTITANYNKATYRFSSKENKMAFNKNPEKYLPQYGGFCAWGVAEKKATFPINPETYDIVDGKLYLFFNGDFKGKNLNTMLPWNAETSKLKEEGDKNWMSMKM